MASNISEDNRSSRSGKSVAVVGAGVSGLAAAYKLKSHGFKVTVFESEETAGGKLRSVSRAGILWDEGANTMTESEPEVRKFLDELGLREKQQFPISQNRRYIVRNGTPKLIPTNPVALIKSNFLSAQSKLQMILEPLSWGIFVKKNNVAKVSNESLEESVAEFFQRHFGKEVVDYLIDPFIAGTSAGDPESLSMRHAFPEIWNLEKRFGSVIVGAVRSKLSAKKDKNGERETSSGKLKRPRGSFSFEGGMQTLTDMLCKEVNKDDLKLMSKVLSLSYSHDGNSLLGNWSVSFSANHNKTSQNESFDAVVMTAPLCNVKEMKISKRGNPFLLNFLPEVNYLPLSVIITTFKKENVKRPLEGFGVLIPSKEQHNGLRTLGTLFSSMMFPDRAPNDLYLYTTFVGGSRNRDLAKASTDELKQVVTSDLRKLLGAEGDPTFLKARSDTSSLLDCVCSIISCIVAQMQPFLLGQSISLYGLDYGSVLEAIGKMEESLPGFFYAGNHRSGLSVGKAIASGCKAAGLVISYLNSSSDNKMFAEEA